MEKQKRLLEIIKEVEDHGIGEVKITLKEDGVWIIRAEKWTEEPSEVCISFAIETIKGWGFGGIEIRDGEYKLLKQGKTIKI